VDFSQLFQLMRQAQTQWAFRPQFFKQLLGSIKRVGFDSSTFENQTPTPRHLLLG